MSGSQDQTRPADAPQRELFAELAIERGYVTERQLRRALTDDDRATDAVSLGQVLLRRGLLDADQLVELLRLQRAAVWRCRGCGQVRLQRGGPAPRCGDCKQPLEPTDSGATRSEGGLAGLQPGATLGRYRIVGELGRGGMGVVVLAEDAELRRQVALKVLDARVASASLLARLHREAQLAAQLRHPGIVTVLDVGQAAGLHYIAMEHVPGGSLDDRRPPRRPLAEALRLTECTARALHYAHERDVVHRDVKLANVLIGADGNPQIADFGLARSLAETSHLTASGAVMGTPATMAPEQVLARSREIGPATDIWGLGVMLYELVSGRRPFPGRTPAQVYRRIVEEPPRPLDGPVWAIAARALAKAPEQRYPTALAMAEDLLALREGRPISARAPSRLAGVARWLRGHRALTAAALGLLVLGGLLIWLLPRLRSADSDRDAAETRLAQEQDAARARTAALAASAREAKTLERLGRLWTQVAVAKQWIFQSHRTPTAIRESLEQATEAVSTFIEAHPDRPQGYYVRARARLVLGELEAAEADLRQALEQTLEFAPGWALLGTVLLARCEIAPLGADGHRQAGDAWRAPLLRESRAALDRAGPDAAAQLERWGLAASRTGEVDAVVVGALREHSVDGRTEAAIARLTAAHARAPSEAYAYWLGSLSRTRAEQLAWQTRALEIAPHHALARFARSVTHYVAGRNADAIADLDHCLALRPRFVMALNNRAALLYQADRTTPALADVDRALALGARGAMVFNNRGAILLKMGRLVPAAADFDRAIAADPSYASAHYGRAQVEFAAGRMSTALAGFDRTLALDPKHAEALNNRGWIHFTRKDHERALADLTRAVEHAPTLAEAWDSRAQILLAMGRLDAAARDAARAIKLRKTYHEPWMTLGRIFERKGDDRKALTAYTQALKLCPKTWPQRPELIRRARAVLKRVERTKSTPAD